MIDFLKSDLKSIGRIVKTEDACAGFTWQLQNFRALTASKLLVEFPGGSLPEVFDVIEKYNDGELLLSVGPGLEFRARFVDEETCAYSLERLIFIFRC